MGTLSEWTCVLARRLPRAPAPSSLRVRPPSLSLRLARPRLAQLCGAPAEGVSRGCSCSRSPSLCLSPRLSLCLSLGTGPAAHPRAVLGRPSWGSRPGRRPLYSQSLERANKLCCRPKSLSSKNRRVQVQLRPGIFLKTWSTFARGPFGPCVDWADLSLGALSPQTSSGAGGGPGGPARSLRVPRGPRFWESSLMAAPLPAASWGHSPKCTPQMATLSR